MGDVHVSIELKEAAEATVDFLCERLLKIFQVDDLGDCSIRLRAQYLEMIEASKKGRKKQMQSLTVAERPGYKISVSKALKAVSDARGPMNWVLLNADGLSLFNAGAGGHGEMRQWMPRDRVLFGVLRLAFSRAEARRVKHVFVHWVGPDVPIVKRGRWNASSGNAQNEVNKHCSVTMNRTAYCLEDFALEDVLQELRRLVVLDDDWGKEGAGDSLFSVEEYFQALSEETQETESEGSSDESDMSFNVDE